MVVPIIIGIGVTVAAITAKNFLAALSKYRRLSSVRIAELNGFRISHLDQNNMNVSTSLRSQFLKYPGGFAPKMTEGEALEILNIKGNEIMKLNQEMLRKRHRKCMMANHPDKGGSAYIGMKVNEAKEVLEKGYMLKK